MLLSWEQGTGKTIISLAASEKLFELGKAEHALILAPASLSFQWEEKILEFTDTPVTFSEAKKKATRTYKPGKGCHYSVVPYSLFRRDYDTIRRHPWDIVICDEAQEFKNYKTKTAQLLKRMNEAVNPTYRWALTGTSISNHLEELYSIFYWVEKTFLPPWPQFEEDHIVRDDLGAITKYRNLVGLNEYLKARMDRKTQNDLKGQMPRLVEQVVQLEQTKEYREYESELLYLLDEMAANLTFDEKGELKGNPDPKVSRAFHAVRQSLCDEHKLKHADDLIRTILNENPSNRIVVFSYYKQPLYELHDKLGQGAAVKFTGDETSDQKRDAIRAFNTDSKYGPRVLLASNAGSSGLDLNHANYAIHLDVPFSHGILDQRNKRITRASSTCDTSVVIYLIMKDSLEQYYYVIVKNKKKLADAVQEGLHDEVTIRPESLRSYLRSDQTSS